MEGPSGRCERTMCEKKVGRAHLYFGRWKRWKGPSCGLGRALRQKKGGKGPPILCSMRVAFPIKNILCLKSPLIIYHTDQTQVAAPKSRQKNGALTALTSLGIKL